ncbi:hypothetical protein ACFW4K_26905 [Nocardiopsis alba]|uniref:hypothetical protein n=1 Tax=Nocardiopsis alba TaxID=53437 RepID=UPI00366FDAC8
MRRYGRQPGSRVLELRPGVRLMATCELWVPLRAPEDQGPRAYAAQMLEMLIAYNLVEDAHLDGGGFVVSDSAGRRRISPEQVLDEYGDRLSQMVTRVMEYSDLTTTRVSVTVGAPGGPVPYIENPADREIDYPRYWPRTRKRTGRWTST